MKPVSYVIYAVKKLIFVKYRPSQNTLLYCPKKSHTHYTTKTVYISWNNIVNSVNSVSINRNPHNLAGSMMSGHQWFRSCCNLAAVPMNPAGYTHSGHILVLMDN